MFHMGSTLTYDNMNFSFKGLSAPNHPLCKYIFPEPLKMVDGRFFFVDGIKIYNIKWIKQALAVTP